MKVKALRELQKLFSEHPEKLDMTLWAEPPYGSCGTVGCIAGWSEIIRAMKENHKVDCSIVAQRIEFQRPDVSREQGRKNLGLTEAQAGRLFLVPNWPAKFKNEYHRAITNEQGAKVTVERIEHFIKTKGKE